MNSETQKPAFRRQIPAGDTHERDVCATCGFVNYVNPKIVTGSIVRHDGKLLLCRRAIEPRSGFWTLPAGFMELGETAEQAAMREAREEANAEIIIERLLAVYTIPRIAQVQIMYLARLARAEFSAGPESLEVRLAGWDEIPWEELAFPSVRWALEQYRSIEGQTDFPPFANPPGEFGGM
jgi:ADP-ribose pyrophosphatase YjhB (NUDIX family)